MGKTKWLAGPGEAMSRTPTRRHFMVAGGLGALSTFAPAHAASYANGHLQGHWLIAENGKPGAVLLRKEFTVQGKVARAILFTAAFGAYETYLNGRRVDVGGQGIPKGRILRDVPVCMTDVTPFIVEGVNGIGGFVAKGHFARWAPIRYSAQPELTFADGARDLVLTDQTWMTSDSPITWSDSDRGGRPGTLADSKPAGHRGIFHRLTLDAGRALR